MQKIGIDTTLSVGVVVLGFSAIVTQTILLREFLTVFSGNELVIGRIFAWLCPDGYRGAFQPGSGAAGWEIDPEPVVIKNPPG